MNILFAKEIRAGAVRHLIAGEGREDARLLAQCAIELTELRQIGDARQVDITLRCDRHVREKLLPGDEGGDPERRSEVMARLKEAVQISLPSGFQVGAFDARAAANPIRPAWETESGAIRDLHTLDEITAQSEREIRESWHYPTLGRVRKPRQLLSLIASSSGLCQYSPEDLTPDQAEVAGAVLDLLQGHAKGHTDLEPSALLKLEHVLSGQIKQLEVLKLSVFADNFHPNPATHRTLVRLTHSNDPSIKRSPSGSEYVESIFLCNPLDRPDEGMAEWEIVERDERPDAGVADAKASSQALIEDIHREVLAVREEHREGFQKVKQGIESVAEWKSPKVDGEKATDVDAHKIQRIGRLSYRLGFNEVWLGEQLFDLGNRPKARACIRYLVDKEAFDLKSARHLVKQIDPYVRKQCKLPRSADIKIQHYFNGPSEKLRRLCKDLIKSAGGNGRFYLRVN